MFSFGSNTDPQPWPPLLDGLINDALFQLRPDGDEALLQVVDPHCPLLDSYTTDYRGHFFNLY